MIVQLFGAAMDFMIERTTDCISECIQCMLESKIKCGFAILMRNTG